MFALQPLTASVDMLQPLTASVDMLQPLTALMPVESVAGVSKSVEKAKMYPKIEVLLSEKIKSCHFRIRYYPKSCFCYPKR